MAPKNGESPKGAERQHLAQVQRPLGNSQRDRRPRLTGERRQPDGKARLWSLRGVWHERDEALQGSVALKEPKKRKDKTRNVHASC